MELKTLVVSHYCTNCYILHDPDTGDCVVIDPGGDAGRIISALEEDRLRPGAILLTHGHYDHFGAMWPLYERYSVPVYHNEKDRVPLVSRPPRRLVPPPGARTVDEGDEIRVGSLCLHSMASPGHTPGSMVYLIEDMLFSGDTLFRQGCGRIDLPGSDPESMLRSLDKLRKLPGDRRVLPGHGAFTTLDEERLLNPYLQPGITFVLPDGSEDYGWEEQP